MNVASFGQQNHCEDVDPPPEVSQAEVLVLAVLVVAEVDDVRMPEPSNEVNPWDVER